jgi:hypothetical protein
MLSFKNITYTLIGAAAIVQLNLSPASAESLRGRQQQQRALVDEHGCLASAGYSYCESTATCIQSWVTACPTDGQRALVDEHGCLASAGYSYCESTATCIQSWVTACPTDGHGCLASAGYTFCPETNACIRFDENCPIKGGTVMVGSKELTCAAGARLSDLTSECTLVMNQSDGTTITLAGPYITLDGTYVLPEGCSATVVGCTTKTLMGSF